MRELSSPNFNDRKDGAQPRYLILHYTGTLDGREAEDHYMNADPDHHGGPVSPHYMVDIDGTITRFVPEDKRAWHAGRSFWGGITDMNSHSIGIEIVNPGHERGYRPFTEPQMQALIGLCKDIVTRNAIPPQNVLGHSDIAPDRKDDPGELFDWARLADEGIGLWPRPGLADYQAGQGWLDDRAALIDAFTRAGYDPGQTFDVLVTAFQRHYQPDVFATGRAGTPDRETVARLHWLLAKAPA